MALKKIYLEELARIQERVNSLLEQALLATEYDDGEGGAPGTWTPPVDVLETEGAYLLYAELPGIRRDDIEVAVHDRRLELSGRRAPLGANRNFLRMERSYGPFRRSFELGGPLDAEKISAHFQQGVLRITIPKLGAAAVRVEEAG
ncbi:MAG TPA: Hsp20/alpha crystallin family protein [Thermoanaerobaculia bacterium]|nr:Hsp20/alpha crystallin family protein [Thermoanaerobaculia bacterium]